jgi:hypothetical protein
MSAIGEENKEVIDNEGKQDIYVDNTGEIANEETMNKGITE